MKVILDILLEIDKADGRSEQTGFSRSFGQNLTRIYSPPFRSD
jgi:hypothetical protein